MDVPPNQPSISNIAAPPQAPNASRNRASTETGNEPSPLDGDLLQIDSSASIESERGPHREALARKSLSTSKQTEVNPEDAQHESPSGLDVLG